MIDETRQIPAPYRHILWAVFGVTGYYFVTSGGEPPAQPIIMTLAILARGIFSGFAWYGAVSLLRDFKSDNGKMKDLCRRIKNTHKDAFNKKK